MRDNDGKEHTIATIGNDVEWIIIGMDKIDKRFDGLNKKFAHKWVQTIMTGIVSAILVAVIGAIMGLILIRPAMAMMIIYTDLFA